MIFLDHNIAEDQVELLRQERIRCQQIGIDVGRPEWDDFQEILRYLHQQKQPTLISRDLDFFHPRLRHKNYALVVLAVPIRETAIWTKRFLRHPGFRTKASRCGKVIQLSPKVITWWEIGNKQKQHLLW